MKYHLREVTKMIERLKVCWYALTKKHYCFFAYDREEYHNSGAKCYIEDEAEKSKIFCGALNDMSNKLLSNLKEE